MGEEEKKKNPQGDEIFWGKMRQRGSTEIAGCILTVYMLTVISVFKTFCWHSMLQRDQHKQKKNHNHQVSKLDTSTVEAPEWRHEKAALKGYSSNLVA